MAEDVVRRSALRPEERPRARPGDLRRAVLRPRLRLRHHPALALLLAHFTPLGALRDRCCCCWRSGGSGSTPPGSPTGSTPADPGAAPAFRADARRPHPVGLDPAGLRRPRPGVRGAYAACRSGAPSSCCGRCAAQPALLPQFPAHRVWLVFSGAVLDRRRACRTRRPPRLLERSRWRSNMSGRPSASGRRGLGRSATSDWDIEGGHMAERCGLFIIIALGESILVTGATFAHSPGRRRRSRPSSSPSSAAWRCGGSTSTPAPSAAAASIAASSDPGRLGALAYTYMHLPIVAGIIVTAVGDEFVLAHPGGTEPRPRSAVLGGPALYVVGNLLFKRAVGPHAAIASRRPRTARAARTAGPERLASGHSGRRDARAGRGRDWEHWSLGRSQART